MLSVVKRARFGGGLEVDTSNSSAIRFTSRQTHSAGMSSWKRLTFDAAAAKCAEASSRKAISLACWATVARSRTNSARSCTESGCPAVGSVHWVSVLRTLAIRHRSSRTHVYSRSLCRSNSRATSATRRCPSITMCAALARYSGVNERRRGGISASSVTPSSCDVNYLSGRCRGNCRPKRRSRSELVTTLTEENPIAAPAMIGFSRPSAARGMAAVL